MLPTLARLSLNAAPVGAPEETALDGSETKQDTLLTVPADVLIVIQKFLLLGKLDEACKTLTHLCSTLPCGEKSNQVYEAACAQLFGANTTPAVLELLSPKTVFGDWKQLFKMLCIAFSPNEFEPMSDIWARHTYNMYAFELEWTEARKILLNHRSESQPVAFWRDTPRATQRMLDEMLFFFLTAFSTAQWSTSSRVAKGDATQKEHTYYSKLKYLLSMRYPIPEAAICWLLVNRGARFYRLVDDYLRGLLMKRLKDDFEGVNFNAALYNVQDDIYLPEKLEKIEDDNAELLITLQEKEKEVKLKVAPKDHFLVDAMLFSTPLLPQQYYTFLDEELRKVLLRSKEKDFDDTKEKIMRLRTLGAIFDPSYGKWTQIHQDSIFVDLLGFYGKEGIRKRLLEWLFEENGDEIYGELRPPFGAIVVSAKQHGRSETFTENVWLGLVKAVYSRYKELRTSKQLRSIFFSFLGHFKAVRNFLGPNGPLGDTDTTVYAILRNTTLMDQHSSNPHEEPGRKLKSDYEVRTVSQWMEHLSQGANRSLESRTYPVSYTTPVV